MDARAFDNIPMTALPDLLDQRRTLARYFPLIPYRERIVSASGSLGIADKYGYLEASRELRDSFLREAGLDPAMEPLFVRFLHLYDLKPRRLADACAIEGFPAELGRSPLPSAQAYLQSCLQDGLRDTAGKLQINVDCARTLFCLCDLMRLPGVKWLRAKLYYDCGFPNLTVVAQQEPAHMRLSIASCLETHGSERAVPLPKELATQIAVAGALPPIQAR